MGARAPSGTVTFLFTDIEGSTRLWQDQPVAMAEALRRHDELARRRFDDAGGYLFATGGDGFAVAFDRASGAVDAAVGLQADLDSETWPEGAPLRVRMALHTGEAVERDGDYFGPAVNTAARLLTLTHAGQVRLTDATRSVLSEGRQLTDLGVHRLRDLSVPIHVWQVGDEEFAPLRSIGAVPGNLPAQSSELVGRVGDLAAAADCVGRARLVTLTGVGGVGKTRLAVELAAALSDQFADGCWLVDLSVREADDDLGAALARAMGANASASSNESLLTHLRDRRALIVLDNCEHLLDSAADLVEALLGHTSQVRVVATSREPLGVDGEVVMRVPSLAVRSDVDAGPAPAVMLFRARAAEAGGRLGDDPGTAAAIEEICRHLDGIPLAIELAAARTRGLTATEILDRLSERFRLLGGGRRSQERHRTLLAAVQWSHDLLGLHERVVWRRLSEFVGGFDLAAAEAVVGEPGTLDALLALVDKSMVQAEGGGATTRYTMLETLRQFAADQLVDAGEVDAVRGRLSDHYLRLVRPPLGILRGPDERANRAALEPERENVLAAAQHLLSVDEHERLAAELCASSSFWEIVAPSEAVRLCEACWSRVHPRTALTLVGRAAFMAWVTGDPLRATQLGRDHLRRARELAEPPELAGLLALAIAATNDPPPDLPELLADGLAAADREDDATLRTMMFATSTSVRSMMGDAGWVGDLARAEREQTITGSDHLALTLAVTAASAEIFPAGGGPKAGAARLRAVEHLAPAADHAITCWYHWMRGQVELDLDPPLARRHFRLAAESADAFGAGLVRHLALEGVALTYARDGRVEDAAVLRGASAAFFDDAELGRGPHGDEVCRRLDELLRDLLDSGARSRADAMGRTMTVADLMELALRDDTAG